MSKEIDLNAYIQKHGSRHDIDIFDHVTDIVHAKIRNRLTIHHELDYDSAVSSYGYTLKRLADGTLLYDPAGVINTIDRNGDEKFRRGDDHILSRPLETLLRHPQMFNKILHSGAKRSRGEPEAIIQNVQRLGLSDYYTLHPQGIEVKKPETVTHGINLFDIYRVENPHLQKIDRYYALHNVGGYLRNIHQRYGAVGEVLVSDIIFQKKEGAIVSEPILSLPDIIFNRNKYSEEDLKNRTEPKAVDMLDLIMSIGSEELRKTGREESAEAGIAAVLNGYADQRVIAATKSLAKRVRLTLTGETKVERLSYEKTPKVIFLLDTVLRPPATRIGSLHNKARFTSIHRPMASHLRQIVINQCTEYLNQAQA